jgi:transposase
MAIDTLGHLLALHVTPANVDDRAEVGKLADAVQNATGETVDLIYVDQGYNGKKSPMLPASTASNCAWSSLQRPRRDSSCCPSVWS